MSFYKARCASIVTALIVLCAVRVSGQTNGVLREIYSNLPGSSIPDLTNAAKFPNSPDGVFLESTFEAPANFAENYGQRMRGLVVPPITGSYVFWISGDDNSALYLSTDEAPANRVQIASVSSWSNSREWNKEANQHSVAIALTNGFRYYSEALQKEGGGGDNLAVAWQKPGDPAPANGDPPIPGTYLLPVGVGPPVITVQPTNVSVVESSSATFTVQLYVNLGASYQWRRAGVDIPGATNSLYQTPPTAMNESGTVFSCRIVNPYGSTNSASATLTVIADVTKPSLLSAGSLGSPQIVTVIFSEPVEAASALNPLNYTINNSVTVLSAVFGPDAQTIVLTTTPMVTGIGYTMTVNNVRDRAATPNTILPNSQLAFALDVSPLAISFLRPSPEPIGPSTRHGPVVISEIMYHPTNRLDGKDLEYLELFNSNPYSEDLSGYRLSGEVDFTFPPNTVLGARSYLVVAAVPADIQSVYGIGNVTGPYTNKLSNSAGTVRLRNREGGIVFEVNYSSDPPWPVAADGVGHSLALARPSLGEHNPDAWAASDVVGGSPGVAEPANANPYRTVVINEFLAHTDPPDFDFIELYNYSTAAVDLSGCFLSDDATTNKFVIPPGTTIPPQGIVFYSEAQLGFALNAAGESLYFKRPDNRQVLDAVRFGAQENGVSMGHFPDGAPGFYRLQTKTLGTKNGPLRLSPVVINEIMYDPVSGDDDDQFVELYNRTGSPVDLSGWSFTDGIQYTIPNGMTIPPSGYLVIAKNAAQLMVNHPGLTGANTLGDFDGTLAHGGEYLALAMPDEIASTNAAGNTVTNTIHIVVDDVTYGTGGRWGKWAHGGGSSLELIDARSDRRLAPNWADSDESAKSGWVNIEFTGVLDNGSVAADALQVILLGPGECLVDNVEVFASGGQNLIANSDFESGLTGWVRQGNHEDSSWETGQGYNGSTHSLHIRATDRGDTGANRIRTALTSTLNPGQTATLRAKVRWLTGHPEILLRLHGNWLEATGNILTTQNLGSPGQPNSRGKPNVGPAITEVRHSPVLPAASQPVTVVARVHDPDDLAALVLKYRVDPSMVWNPVTMVNKGAGLFSATIPGQAAGKVVAFYVQATDNFSPVATTLFPNDAPARECLVRFGDPAQGGNYGTYRLWMTQATFDRWSNREHLSNRPLDCTFVYGTSRVVYNMGGQYSGSPYHAPGFDSPTGNVCDYVLTFPDDDTLLGETDATLQWPGNGGGDNSYQREQTAYWIAEQIGLPYCYRRSINLFVNGVRRAEMFEDVQQPNGDLVDEYFPDGKNGDLHKVQLWFEFDDPAVNFSANGASLQNFTTTGGQKKLARYRWTFARRAAPDSMSNYTNLFALVDAANFGGLGTNYRRQLEAVVDVDNWLKTYAVEHIVGNNDSFAYGGGQNMYSYKPVGDTWKQLIWDIDFAFASLGPTGDDLFAGVGRSCGIDLAEPAYLRRYWQILQDLANGPLVATRVNPVLNNKYNAMIANGRTVDNASSIQSYLSQRRSYILGLITANASATFAITSNNGVGFSTNKNLIAITGSAPLGVRSFTINGALVPVFWTSLSNWVASTVLSAGNNTLNITGLDAQGNVVPGATGTINVDYTGPDELAQDKLVINEIMYNPVVPDTSFVEICNTSTNNGFDVSAWRLDGADFTFPPGSVIPAGGFAVIAKDRVAFAAAYGGTIPLSGEFAGTLDNGGETLRLIKPGITPAQDVIVDEVRYDGEAPWPSAANGTGASLQLLDPAQDNNRVANWSAVPTNGPTPPPQWRYVTATGSATASTLYLYLQSAGTVFVDDLKLVSGNVPEAGANVILNGDFESAFPGPWTVSANHAGSTLDTATKHSGTASLRVVAASGGTTQGSSIWQLFTPALAIGQPYTLSFWYLENTNGGTLTIRLSGNGVVANVNLAPGGNSGPLRYTPGTANSLLTSLPAIPALWLNEVLPNNLSGAVDRFGHHHPWAELYNGGATNIALSGCFLANNYSNLTQWSFPTGTTIGAGQFLVLWLDGNPGESISNELHTTFTIPPGTGSLALVSTNGGRTNILDYFNYDVPQADRSYGSFLDGAVTGRRVFYYTTAGGTNNPASAPLTVFVNEWMADNLTTLADPADGDFEDWFEIYNPGSSIADLSGFYLGTSLTNKTKFLIPSGYSIPAHGRLLVWADNESGQNATNHPDLHANFKLSKSGEAIGIFAADGTVVDFVSFGAQTTDQTEGRFPDGAVAVAALTAPTPRNANYLALSNTPPVVGAISNPTVFEGQLLLFSVLATDTNAPAQSLTFSLDPGAPTNAAINPANGLFSWRPTLAQTPGTNLIVVRVTDNGVPPLSTTRSFQAIVVPRPVVTSILPTGGGSYAISVVTVPGKTYRLESKSALTDPTWLPDGAGIVANGTSLTLHTELSGGSQRFYRIVASE